MSLCLIFQALVWVTPSRRPNSMLEMPPLPLVRWYMARNQVHSGTLVAAKIVPAITDVCRRQAVQLVKRPGLDEAVMLPCANRADKAGWPAPAHHRLPALILCSVKNSKLGLAEPLLKLHLVARHRSNSQNSRMFLFCTMP